MAVPKRRVVGGFVGGVSLLIAAFGLAVMYAEPAGSGDAMERLGSVYAERLASRDDWVGEESLVVIAGTRAEVFEAVVSENEGAFEYDWDLALSLLDEDGSPGRRASETALDRKFFSREDVRSAIAALGSGPVRFDTVGLDWFERTVPESAAGSMWSVQLLAMSGINAIYRGDYGAGVSRIEAGASVARGVESLPLFINALFARACWDTVYIALMHLGPEDGVPAGTLSRLRALVPARTQMEALLGTGDAEALFAEVRMGRVYTSSGRLVVTAYCREMSDLAGMDFGGRSLVERFGTEPSRLTNLHGLLLPRRGRLEEVRSELGEMMVRALAGPPEEMVALGAEIDALFGVYGERGWPFFERSWLGYESLLELTLQTETRRRMASLHLAALEFEAVRGRVPASQEELVGAGLLDDVLVGPSTGLPLTFEAIADEVWEFRNPEPMHGGP